MKEEVDGEILDRTTKIVNEDIMNAIRVIRVNVDGRNGSPLISMPISSSTTAKDFCNKLAQHIGIIEAESSYFSLVLVISRTLEDLSYHTLHTLKDDEMLITEHDRILTKYSSKSSSSSILSRWFYKDIRTDPIDLDGEISGDSSSDDENEVSMSDLKYLVQGERRGYLLKKSSSDHHLWRRRLCVLTDKFWFIKVRGEFPRTGSIAFGSTNAKEVAEIIKCPYGFVVHGMSKSHYFRASSDSEQQLWLAELRQRTASAVANNVLVMAEMIICDEENALASRTHRLLENTLVSKDFRRTASNLRDPDRGRDRDRRRDRDGAGGNDGVGDEDGDRKEGYPAFPCDVSTRSVHSISTRTLPHDMHSSSGDSDESDARTQRVCATLALLLDIQHYKEVHRHELRVKPRDQWMTALQVYRDHLEHLLPLSSDDTQHPHSVTTRRRSLSRSASDLPISDTLLSAVHKSVFSNIRRRNWDEVGGGRGRGGDSGSSNSSDEGGDLVHRSCVTGLSTRSSFGEFFSWTSSASSNSNTAVAASGNNSSDGNSNGNGFPNGQQSQSQSQRTRKPSASTDCSNGLQGSASSSSPTVSSLETDYEVLDTNRRPGLGIFEDLIADIERNLSLENRDNER
eukprot:gene6308-12766_t